jgi:hypothetical protein
MSQGLHPIAVDLARVERAFGCRDEALLAEASGRFDISFDEGEDDPDDPPDEQARAARDIIAGRPFRDELGGSYGIALWELCKHFGRALPNEHFVYVDPYVFEVDEALARLGIPPEAFSMQQHLMYRGAPIAIPRYTRDRRTPPFFGYLKVPELGAALQAIGAADLAAFSAEVRDAVAEVRGWLEACSAEGRDLVCFCS